MNKAAPEFCSFAAETGNDRVKLILRSSSGFNCANMRDVLVPLPPPVNAVTVSTAGLHEDGVELFELVDMAAKEMS